MYEAVDLATLVLARGLNQSISLSKSNGWQLIRGGTGAELGAPGAIQIRFSEYGETYAVGQEIWGLMQGGLKLKMREFLE